MTLFAAIQMASGPNVQANLIEAGRLIEKAAAEQVALVVLPENFAHFGMREQDKLAIAENEGQGPIQEFLSQCARKHSVWIVGGSVPLRCHNHTKVRAACLVFDDKGQSVVRYDKIHLFDVHIEETGENYKESQTIEAGNHCVVVDTPFGRLGIAVCYDLRFPELFRELLAQGMEICTVPAAFTAITGRAHWETLLRARAIENLTYFVASAQGGYHLNGRETYGHSMIVDPWGHVLDCLPSGSGIVIAAYDASLLETIRRSFPCLEHARLSCAFDQLAGES